MVLLRDADANVRAQATSTLEELTPPHKRRTVALAVIPLVKDTAINTAAAAVQALGPLGSADKRAVDTLISVARKLQNQRLSRAAIFALGRVDPAPLRALPLLVRLVGTPDARLRLTTISAIEGFVKHTQPKQRQQLTSLVKPLARAMKRSIDDTAFLRSACNALATLGPIARSALPALRLAAKKHYTLRFGEANNAIEAITGKKP